jgi:hypothetical protein
LNLSATQYYENLAFVRSGKNYYFSLRANCDNEMGSDDLNPGFSISYTENRCNGDIDERAFEGAARTG